MVKYIRKKFPGNARRSKSNAVTENLPPEVYLGPDHRLLGQRTALKKRSYSFCHSPKTTKKKRVMKRIVRTKFEADHNELIHMITEVTNNMSMKRQMEQIFDEDTLRKTENPGKIAAFMQNELENNEWPKVPRKLNRFTAISPIIFRCSRTTLNFPCFPESDVLKIPAPLATLFHQGVREEDCDSTDSVVERGVSNCMAILSQTLGLRVFRHIPTKDSTCSSLATKTQLWAEDFDPTDLSPKFNG